MRSNLRKFISEWCEVDEIATCTCHELYDSFSDWCMCNGLTPPAKNVVGGALRQMKMFVSYKSDATRKWRGVRIKEGEER